MSSTQRLRVLALIPEIMTMVRVDANLAAAGWKVQSVESDAAFLSAFYTDPPAVAVADLGNEALDIETIADHCRRGRVPLVVFGRHTDAGRLRAAKNAGADAVHPRGKFLEDPASLVSEALASDRART